MLHSHDQGAEGKRQHFADTWGAKGRPKCLACKRTGYASKQMSWMAMGCDGWGRISPGERQTLETTLVTLQARREELQQHSTQLKRIIAQF